MKGGGPNGAPSVEAYCPFGGLESLYQFLTSGFIRRIEPSAGTKQIAAARHITFAQAYVQALMGGPRLYQRHVAQYPQQNGGARG